MASIDATGTALNTYTRTAATSGPVPDAPWAVYLAGRDERYRLLVFDLDAKAATAASHAAAVRDATVLTGLLDDAGIASVVSQSGPTGGRHVWVGLSDPVPAPTVATLAQLAAALCPTLDKAPLTNPVTGCARPPGAPHRAGGRSEILTGSLRTLTAPSTSAEQVTHLIERIAQLVGPLSPAPDVEAHTPLPVDEHGHLYLPGSRRPLPAPSSAALEEDAGSGDASAVMWRVLVGAAAARWRHSDIAELAQTTPGLEHLRSVRQGSTRTPRPARGQDSPAMVLKRQWHRAVRYVAAHPRAVGQDDTFDERAAEIAEHVRDVQARADASGGRWSQPCGPADRRVLDALCVLALQAVRHDIEADIRRLALLTGIGRETARTALQRLTADGWIRQTAPAEGPRGAHWSIRTYSDPPVLHNPLGHRRSQAVPRPLGTGPAHRSALLSALSDRLQAARHDVFTSKGLGHLAGNVYARLRTHRQTTGATVRHELTPVGHLADVTRAVERLVEEELVSDRSDRLHRRPIRREHAVRLGVHGTLDERETRYRIERAAWAWWRAEHAWMSSPGHVSARRRAGAGQLVLFDADRTVYGPHPRRSDGRCDFAAARALLTAGNSDGRHEGRSSAHLSRQRRSLVA